MVTAVKAADGTGEQGASGIDGDGFKQKRLGVWDGGILGNVCSSFTFVCFCFLPSRVPFVLGCQILTRHHSVP